MAEWVNVFKKAVLDMKSESRNVDLKNVNCQVTGLLNVRNGSWEPKVSLTAQTCEVH